MRDEEIRALAARAAEQSGSAWWACATEREDGTAQVYSPCMGPARRIVPVAETSGHCGRFIAAMCPAYATALLERAQAAERERDDLRTALRESAEQPAMARKRARKGKRGGA